MSLEGEKAGLLSEENFCGRCGLSLRPLNQVHVSRPCSDCGKTVHVVERGEGGEGIKIRKGDRVLIPPGTIELSLVPKPGTYLYKPGLSMLLRTMILHGHPDKPKDVGGMLDEYEKLSIEHLRANPKLQGLDLDSADDSDEVFQRLSQDKDAQDFWAYMMGLFAVLAREGIAENDAQKVAFAAYHAAASHALFRLKDEVVEETLWRGYLANRVVYESAAAATTTPAQAEAVKKLEPLFSKLEESVLHTWVEDGLPIGPRIGVTAVPEPTLRALARWHLSAFNRRRDDQRRESEEKRTTRDLRVKWFGVGAAAVAGLGTLILTILKATGIVKF